MSNLEPSSAPGTGARILLVSTPVDHAERLARGLVEARLAACVQRWTGVRSTYRWKGRVEDEPEALLLIKTLAPRIPELESWLLREHPYEVPEFLSIPVDHAEGRYFAWLVESLGGGGATPDPKDDTQDGSGEGAPA